MWCNRCVTQHHGQLVEFEHLPVAHITGTHPWIDFIQEDLAVRIRQQEVDAEVTRKSIDLSQDLFGDSGNLCPYLVRNICGNFSAIIFWPASPPADALLRHRK